MTLEEQYAAVKAELIKGHSPAGEKHCILLCAQPGAGKTTRAVQWANGYIRMDGDCLMELCSNLMFVANYVSSRFLREIAGEGYRILYETPLTDRDALMDLCLKGQALGYTLSLTAIACDAVTALESTLQRSREALREGRFVRLCSYGFYRTKTEAFLNNFPVFATSGIFNEVSVLSRDGKVFYRGTDGLGAADILEKEVNLPGLSERKDSFQQRYLDFVQTNGMMSKQTGE